MKLKCLVTGGAGFIASHLVDKLIEENCEVAIIDNLSTGKKENINPKADFYEINIQDPRISEVFGKVRPDVVFHYAAQIDVRKSVDDPVESAKINILGGLNLLENCKKFGTKKIVFASSGGAIYGEASVIPTPEDYSPQPVSPYGIEKLIFEHYLYFYKREYNLDYLILRFSNVYGPRQNFMGEAGVIAIFCNKMLSGSQPIIYGDGKQTRDFIFVADIIKANILCIKNNKSGIFNIGTGVETEINDVFRKLANAFNSEIKEVHEPARAGEQQRSCLNFAKAKSELGWQPQHDLDSGLMLTKDWFKISNMPQ